MNMKAIIATIAALVMVVSAVAVVESYESDATADTSFDDTVYVGVGYWGEDDPQAQASFKMKISEAAYDGLTYTTKWTVVENNTPISITADFSSGTPNEVKKITQTNGPSYNITENGDGVYTLVMSDIPDVNADDVTYTLTFKAQITITSGNDPLVLNEVSFTATVVAYDNNLGDGSVSGNLVVGTSYTSTNAVSISFGDKTFASPAWYATGLPSGLSVNNSGKIIGMANDTFNEEITVVIYDGVREYYGTVTPNIVAASGVTYTYEITSSGGEDDVIGSGTNFTVMSDNTENKITLEISGTPAFDGVVTVINATTGVRGEASKVENTSGTDVSFRIPVNGVGTYYILVNSDYGAAKITLNVVAQTSGTVGVGFVVIGS